MAAVDEKHAGETLDDALTPLPNISRGDLVELVAEPGKYGYVISVGWVKDADAEEQEAMLREFQGEDDDEEDEEFDADGEDQAALIRALLAPLAPRDVRVEWLDDRGVCVHPSSALRTVARALLPADTVVRVANPMRSGTVVSVNARVDLKLLAPASPEKEVLRDVPMQLISRLQDPAPGRLVAVRPAPGALAVGVVARAVTQLTVQLRDGAVCEVDDAGEHGPFPVDDERGAREQQQWGETEYYPGMRVTAPAPFWQRQRFTQGQFNPPPAPRRGRGRGRGGRGGRGGRPEAATVAGVVQAQRVVGVLVGEWLYAHACDPSALPEPLPLAQLVPLDHYSYLMTLVGDRVSLAPSVLAAASTPEQLATLTLSAAERVGHARTLASSAEVVCVRTTARVRWQDGELSEAIDCVALREPLGPDELAAQTWQCGTLVQRADADDDALYAVTAAPLNSDEVTLCALSPDAPATLTRAPATALLHLAHEQPRVADPETGAPRVCLLDADGALGTPERVALWELQLLKPLDEEEDDDSDALDMDEFDSEEEEDEEVRAPRGRGAPRFRFGAGADSEEDEDEDEEDDDAAEGGIDTSKALDFSWLKDAAAEGDATVDAGDDDLTPEERHEVVNALHVHFHTHALPIKAEEAPAEAAGAAEARVEVVAALPDHHFASAPVRAVGGGVAALAALLGALPSWCSLFVSEARLDLLRLVLRPAPNTLLAPLALVVDVYLPPEYPTVPPQLWAHTRGERVHAALHASGRVCLRVLGEWHGVGHAAWQQGASKLVDALTELHDALSSPHAHLFAEPHLASELGDVLQDTDLLQAALRYDEHVLLAALRLTLAQLTSPPAPEPVAAAVRAHWAAHRAAALAVADYAAALLPWRRAAAQDPTTAPPMPAAPLDALVALHVPLNPSVSFLAALEALLPRLRDLPSQ